jgi:hypothetical protein
MQGGDISSATPPRIIVGIDVVVKSEWSEDRKRFRKSSRERVITGYNWAELSALWNRSFRFGLAVELAASAAEGWTEKHLDQVMEKLDNRGGNPFNNAELFDSTEDLIAELPYRVNLKGVVDIRGRVAYYGSWGIELDNLN